MAGWMVECACLGERKNGLVDELMVNDWVDGSIDIWKIEWVDGWTDGRPPGDWVGYGWWMGSWVNGWMGEWEEIDKWSNG